jgi:hypothetical protein
MSLTIEQSDEILKKTWRMGGKMKWKIKRKKIQTMEDLFLFLQVEYFDMILRKIYIPKVIAQLSKPNWIGDKK